MHQQENRQIVVYSHNGVPHSNEEKQTAGTCKSIYDAHRHYVEPNSQTHSAQSMIPAEAQDYGVKSWNNSSNLLEGRVSLKTHREMSGMIVNLDDYM